VIGLNGRLIADSIEMPTFLTDVRYSFRVLRKTPGFSIVALLVLALGIGANTAIFSVVNSVVLNPLPYPGSDRLALIWETDLKDGIKREGPSGPNFLDWREQSRSFEDMALLEVGTGTLTGGGEPEQVVGLRVTTNFLSMLGARTVLGRGFTTAEGRGEGTVPGCRSHERILEASLRIGPSSFGKKLHPE
jgi:MacB-like periplasmic core domain